MGGVPGVILSLVQSIDNGRKGVTSEEIDYQMFGHKYKSFQLTSQLAGRDIIARENLCLQENSSHGMVEGILENKTGRASLPQGTLATLQRLTRLPAGEISVAEFFYSPGCE
ncbi:hypothetical protein JWG39_04620 [Desulforhopalus vacuolatus]|uniref:hypothetical protein n=1 Tax=Desulforhopalus vacuolatus TaxID=40414 RepID=UPI001965384A|nr:hypothetical protein [Desulforhopalus vacuolatus]MBM9519100.1 hypothetical protein [Desulforhopalus vacuolatus]